MAIVYIDIRSTLILVEREGRRSDALARAAAVVEANAPDDRAVRGFNEAYGDAQAAIASCRLVHRSDWSHIVDRSNPATDIHSEFAGITVRPGDLVVQLDYECVVEVETERDDEAACDLAMRFHRSVFIPDDARLAQHNRENGTSYVEARGSSPFRSDHRAKLEPKIRRLLEWRNAEAAKAADAGEASFMGLPDAWYDAGRYGCVQGHVSTTALGTETRGDRCLACDGSAIIIPPMEEAEFAALLPTIMSQALQPN